MVHAKSLLCSEVSGDVINDCSKALFVELYGGKESETLESMR